MKHYAGIGSRETPQEILELMTKIASYLSKEDYILRSGGADGADSAFESGAGDKKEIYLPWTNFNKNQSPLVVNNYEAFKLAAKFHPRWESLKGGVKKLMARNCCQVLGKDLDIPSEFIICWTPGGKEVGGTSQAIRIAKHYHIKIYNLAVEEDLKYWIEKI